MDRKVKFKVVAKGDANGLADQSAIQQLLDDPTKMHVGIVIFNAPKSETDMETDTETIEIRMRRIEAIFDDRLGDASALQRLLIRATERRTGETVLTSELEDDVRAAFEGLALDDGSDGGDGDRD